MEIIGGLVRLLLGMGAGALVKRGLIDPTGIDCLTGLGMGIFTGIWSAAAKSDKVPFIKF